MKKPIILSALCVAAALVLFWVGFLPLNQPQAAPREEYALVIQSDTGSFVMQLQKGAQQAANELGVHLLVCARDAVCEQPGLAGAALWLDDPKSTLAALKERNLPALVVGQQLSGTPYVTGDDNSAGKQLMRFGLNLAPADQVTLLLDDEDAHSAARGASALTWARAQGAAILSYEEDFVLPPETAVVVCMSARATVDMTARKGAGTYPGLVLGVDTGETRVSDLENGLVTAMALNSPYAMGYLALNRLYALRNTGAAENAYSGVLLATPENMYQSENVKQVFPLLN